MSSPTPQKTTRKAGAPYGNHNALKHGFYSRCFSARCFRTGELSALEAVDAAGLQDEIAAMRIYIRRFIESTARAPHSDMIFLDAIGLAATRLASLLKIQKLLERQSSQVSADLNQALAEVIKELGIKHDWKPG